MNESIATPLMIAPRRFGDNRGWFMETYSEVAAAKFGIHDRFVQDNHSLSAFEGTIRGIHFQKPPHAQAKLVHCVRGSILDYAVDLRRGSPTFGHHIAAKLTAEGGEQLYVPVGYGHAFVTLEPDVEVVYKVTDIYAPECDGGIVWSDRTIGISWPLPASGPILSDKDQALPTLAEFNSPFVYDGRPLEPLSVP
ncbi:dTDP-4-dehydrorhamnose 3,5-epimerase [Brevundimonas sp. LM2]|uniref:dTDP-4-dehydrorhamnose 3,5-epimerase n=1 Tax=Brevundimonas sp. LM2 TaxID=1938605 RepID=UPI000983981A|nr:dTDP-4-dehydrorhamnose 3,5-epimerase [Brevundimonas sp. LM2]AQR60894.1 dTDP-4-dehydrorhamnose 3,5-epimerase [Brevundimonas sp. LM2]